MNRGRQVQSALLGLVTLVFARGLAQADSTWVYAVQLSATTQNAPPAITLNWEPDQYGAASYQVFRKSKNDTSWGTPLALLPGSATSFTDATVFPGQAYEYQVSEDAVLGYRGYGYIYAGMQVPATERRGKVILAVAANMAAALDAGLTRLQNDLVGDGWQVLRHDVPSDAAPEFVRGLIQADYTADAQNVNTVFLFGHLPILLSGNLNYDSHGYRAMAADGYYGDMNDDWPTGPSSSPSFFPSDVRLMVGRVDFYNMPGLGASSPWPSETDLLRQYLDKDHNWRFKLLTAPRRALMANRIGDIGGIAPAATGYRNFEPLVGPGNIVEANVADAAPDNERWISLIASGPYLWTFGCGGGTDTTVSQLGIHGLYHDAWSTDIVGQGAQVIFAMLDGSHFGDWDHSDNLLRSVLAAPTYGLTACLAGGPHWYLHHMALGETIGFSARLTMNNSTLYQNQSNYLARAIYINLMGDPTLRMEAVAPPANLSGSAGNGTITLDWSSSADAVAGYLIYRSATPAGPFERISSSAISATGFVDSPGAGTYTYMVRAVALQQNPSGSYYNLSQGIFITVNIAGGVPPITAAAVRGPAGLVLTWSAQAGVSYHVEAQDQLSRDGWTNLSRTITAAGSTSQWSDTSAFSTSRRFYRVVSP